MRTRPLDLASLHARIDSEQAALAAVDILPSPPPLYSELPPSPTATNLVANSENDHQEEQENSSNDSDDDDDDVEYMIYASSDDDDALEGSELLGQQDWDNVSGDLTKRYNRLKQHVGAISHSSSQELLPAQNQHASRVAQLKLREQRRAQHQQAASAAASSSQAQVHGSKLDSSLAALSSRYSAALNLSPLTASASPSSGGISYAAAAEPSFTSNAATRKGGSERHAVMKDKSDRATVEQVLDDRTRLVLLKMLGRGRLERVEGCVSTGKEANVYHALGRLEPEADPPSPLVHLAIKIYKTSILTFKARSKYLVGEHRFKNGYSKVKNPRKMVRLWAEKEMRNLKRLEAAGIRCPKAVEVRGNVLVMTFLGKEGLAAVEQPDTPGVPPLPAQPAQQQRAEIPSQDASPSAAARTSTSTVSAMADEDGSVIPAREHAADWEASPRLKDAVIPSERLSALYIEVLHVLRRMWRVCKLVHADFSEYNILYSLADQHLYTIDVSQSVEGDHPHAFDFLRADIGNVDEFFARRGVRTLGLKRTFELTVEHWNEDKDRDGDEDEQEIAREVERRFALADEAAASAAAAAADQQEASNVGADVQHAERTAEQEAPEQSGDAQSVVDQDAEDEDAIFKQSYIPRNLNEVFDPERDVQRVLRGEKDQLIYSQTVGIVAPTPAAAAASASGSASDDSESDSESDGEEGPEGRESRPRGKRHEAKDEKRERKRAQKEEKREKRKEKMPKKVKNAKIKKTSGKK